MIPFLEVQNIQQTYAVRRHLFGRVLEVKALVASPASFMQDRHWLLWENPAPASPRWPVSSP